MSQTKQKTIMRSRSQSRSPHKNIKTKPIKTQNQIRKQEKKELYNKEVDELKQDFKNLIKLHVKYDSVKPSHQLVFENGSELKILTRPELTNATSEYTKKLLYLKKLYVEGTKHSRIQIVPESYKAAYTPIKVGSAFISFLAPDANKRLPNFGQVPNEDGSAFIIKSNLLDALPRAKEGYFLKNSLTLLMYIYAGINKLKSKVASEGQKNIPDDRMNHIFGKLLALYYQEPNSPKILMSKSGQKMTTYEVVAGKNSKFNPAKIENNYFQSIQSLNIYEAADLNEKDISLLNNPNIRKELLEEYKMIERANTLLKSKKSL